MKIVRLTGLAGLALGALALPVTAYALVGTDTPGTPPAGVHATTADASGPAEPEDTAEPPDPAESPDTESGTGPAHPDGTEGPGTASTAGPAHAVAMKAWARCVAQAASGPKTASSTTPPKLACGDKPLGPGRAKHLAAAPGSPPARKDTKPKAHGRSGTHGH